MKEEIFPLITFDPEKKIWKCLGTGFFINPVGAFISAKHVFMDSDKKTEKTLYSAHESESGQAYIRPIKQIVVHPNADIMIGLLGDKRIEDKNFKADISKYCNIDFESLKNDDEIYTLAFPNTEREDLNESEVEFTFTRRFSEGKIIDFHEDGSPVVRNRCYQTNMKVDSGASGGPVFKNSFIVGVNSSGYSLAEDEEPISFITPIDFILNLEVKEKNKMITVKELVEKGYIKSKQNLA
ncbi:trypsin-like serine protease [Flavobacterium collinsii]|uniref:Peptidase S1 domain-containing protein n=1 Tax=Flavobacterium collinsii TaxID=1114861 RepID=A0ABM8KLA0_9FLAO|nr:trypsin-like serine protease [Flavobacterium collinsii]CAA9200473.1 hypothetical protein FLACOL7796_03259 [Flavobacterium collinsii]